MVYFSDGTRKDLIKIMDKCIVDIQGLMNQGFNYKSPNQNYSVEIDIRRKLIRDIKKMLDNETSNIYV
jgi:hypothetical protein